MTDRISAEEGALHRGAAALDAASGAISGSAARVQSSFGTLSGTWTGDSSQSFRTLMVQWDDDVRHLQQVLHGLRAALAATEQDQQQVEAEHHQVITGLGAMMGGE